MEDNVNNFKNHHHFKGIFFLPGFPEAESNIN